MNSTPISFDQFYLNQWGSRWAALKTALLRKNHYVARLNTFLLKKEKQQFINDEKLLEGLDFSCIQLKQSKTPQPNSNQLYDFYPMDLSSLFPVMALNLQADDRILDLCSAPGGKALALAEKIQSPKNLTLNEISASRRQRLKKVLQNYLPKSYVEAIQVTGFDASLWGLHEPNLYDKILLDVPCSGERHLLHHPKEIKRWTPSRSKQLAQRQYALLASAFLALKVGGRLVYATCSISHLENDEVVHRLKKKKNGVQLVPPSSFRWGEPTKFGWQTLPDTAEGWGPAFFAIIEKKEA